MRRGTICGSASVLLLLATLSNASNGVHDRLEALHKQHRQHRVRSFNQTSYEGQNLELVKRGGTCSFPYDAGLVPVTPDQLNGGWAMSPDQPCKPGNYCPYACPPGQISMQWDPKATTYSYPQSMNGGLYCDNDGTIKKPFPEKPYCQQTASNIGVVNDADGTVAFCQTVLPGNEAMLIPTSVDGHATLAVPGTEYWAGTAAHYYINPPGTSAEEACVWGTHQNPWGNWSPYVAGANEDGSGETFIKLGWNPIYLETTTPFRDRMPNWGVRIECPDGGCNGLPCEIDPAENSVNQMRGGASTGAGGGNFCVVTVSKGSSANFVVFGKGDRGGRFYESKKNSASSTTTGPSAAETGTNSTSADAYATRKYPSNSTTIQKGPSGQPYYSLFDSAAAATAASDGPVPHGPTATEARSTTGGAARQHLSIGTLGLVLANVLWYTM